MAPSPLLFAGSLLPDGAAPLCALAMGVFAPEWLLYFLAPGTLARLAFLPLGARPAVLVGPAGVAKAMVPPTSRSPEVSLDFDAARSAAAIHLPALTSKRNPVALARVDLQERDGAVFARARQYPVGLIAMAALLAGAATVAPLRDAIARLAPASLVAAIFVALWGLGVAHARARLRGAMEHALAEIRRRLESAS